MKKKKKPKCFPRENSGKILGKNAQKADRSAHDLPPFLEYTKYMQYTVAMYIYLIRNARARPLYYEQEGRQELDIGVACRGKMSRQRYIFGDIWRHLETFGLIWRHLETFADIWRHLETFADIQRHLETFRNIRRHQSLRAVGLKAYVLMKQYRKNWCSPGYPGDPSATPLTMK